MDRGLGSMSRNGGGLHIPGSASIGELSPSRGNRSEQYSSTIINLGNKSSYAQVCHCSIFCWICSVGVGCLVFLLLVAAAGIGAYVSLSMDNSDDTNLTTLTPLLNLTQRQVPVLSAGDMVSLTVTSGYVSYAGGLVAAMDSMSCELQRIFILLSGEDGYVGNPFRGPQLMYNIESDMIVVVGTYPVSGDTLPCVWMDWNYVSEDNVQVLCELLTLASTREQFEERRHMNQPGGCVLRYAPFFEGTLDFMEPTRHQGETYDLTNAGAMLLQAKAMLQLLDLEIPIFDPRGRLTGENDDARRKRLIGVVGAVFGIRANNRAADNRDSIRELAMSQNSVIAQVNDQTERTNAVVATVNNLNVNQRAIVSDVANVVNVAEQNQGNIMSLSAWTTMSISQVDMDVTNLRGFTERAVDTFAKAITVVQLTGHVRATLALIMQSFTAALDSLGEHNSRWDRIEDCHQAQVLLGDDFVACLPSEYTHSQLVVANMMVPSARLLWWDAVMLPQSYELHMATVSIGPGNDTLIGTISLEIGAESLDQLAISSSAYGGRVNLTLLVSEDRASCSHYLMGGMSVHSGQFPPNWFYLHPAGMYCPTAVHPMRLDYTFFVRTPGIWTRVDIDGTMVAQLLVEGATYTASYQTVMYLLPDGAIRLTPTALFFIGESVDLDESLQDNLRTRFTLLSDHALTILNEIFYMSANQTAENINQLLRTLPDRLGPEAYETLMLIFGNLTREIDGITFPALLNKSNVTLAPVTIPPPLDRVRFSASSVVGWLGALTGFGIGFTVILIVVVAFVVYMVWQQYRK